MFYLKVSALGTVFGDVSFRALYISGHLTSALNTKFWPESKMILYDIKQYCENEADHGTLMVEISCDKMH